MSSVPPVPSGNLPDDYEDMPASVGMAEMLGDGTIHLHMRTEEKDGTIGEALMIVKKDDKRYRDILAHVPGLKPGGTQPLAPFPEPEIDPDSI